MDEQFPNASDDLERFDAAIGQSACTPERPQETQRRLLELEDGKERWRKLCARVGAVRAEFADRHGVEKLTKAMKDWTWQACVLEMDGGAAVDVGSWVPPEAAASAASRGDAETRSGEGAVDEGMDGEPPERAMADDVAWAYEQLPDFQQAIRDKSEGRQDAILKRAPSGGAKAWLSFAASNPSKFMGDVVPKILGKREEAAQSAAGDPAVFRDDARKQFAMLDLLAAEE